MSFLTALAKPVQSQASAWAEVIAEADTDTGIRNQTDAAGVIDAFVAEASGYDRSLWGLVFSLAPEDPTDVVFSRALRAIALWCSLGRVESE